MTKRLDPYWVQAFNTAKASENKMHDDRVAQKFGFSGGLVPGVDVLAYMIHPAVETWGRDFLARGLIEARFIRPVYDGETVQVTAEPDGEGLVLQVEGGDVRATGTASLTARLPAFALADYPEVEPVAVRAPVDAHSYALLAAGRRRGISCRGPRGRSDLCARGRDASRRAAADHEQGAGRQCHFGAVDSCRQQNAITGGGGAR